MLKIYNIKQFNLGIMIALIICSLDLYSKYVIFAWLDTLPGQQYSVTNFFNLVKVYNRGISFGMFNQLVYGKYILSGVALAITIYLIIWLCDARTKTVSISLGLIIGGAFGNIIDRLLNDAVADFLDFYVNNYHWPAFNVADSAVSVGAVFLIYEEFYLKEKREKEAKKEGK